MYFQICTVVLRSPISALQEGMVENVKFNHEFSLFFAQILLKNDTVPGRESYMQVYMYKNKFWDKFSKKPNNKFVLVTRRSASLPRRPGPIVDCRGGAGSENSAKAARPKKATKAKKISMAQNA